MISNVSGFDTGHVTDGVPFLSNDSPRPPVTVKRLHSVICFAFNMALRELKCYAIFVAAENVQEAIGDRMSKLLLVHPVADGWESHSVDAIAVPDRILHEAVLAIYQAEHAAMEAPITWGSSPIGDRMPPSHPPMMDLMTVPGNPLSELRVEDLPRLSQLRITQGLQVVIGSAQDGKMLPFQPLDAAALAEAQAALYGAIYPPATP